MEPSILEALLSLPVRSGPPPETGPAIPHQQLTQNAPVELQEALFVRAQSLAGVTVLPSRVSVPGARAFVLDGDLAGGPPEAFMVEREFAHLHPPYDGSLHLTLPHEGVDEVVAKGWGELHPAARVGTVTMVFGPRDVEELETVWVILRASHAFARGDDA